MPPLPNNTYDYIVVGSGAGGGPLAANLARAGYSVLLLEAGGDAGASWNYQVPLFHGLATEDPAQRWDYFVSHYEDPQRGRQDSKFVEARGGVLYPRAGTLGGCTAHNALITVCPRNRDWDAIARLTGDASWAADRMRTYFERLERCQYRGLPVMRRGALRPLLRVLNPARHGFDGWLSTNTADAGLILSDGHLLQVLAAAAAQSMSDRRDAQASRTGANLDPNDWRVASNGPEGLCLIPLATEGGKRRGPREYLTEVRQAHPDRLTIQTDALATRVLFDGNGAAQGVEFLHGAHAYRADPAGGQAGETRTAYARREVVLAAGAFNTPQILMLSGLGPRQALERHGIAVRADLPGVGSNLQDRYEIGVVTAMRDEFATANRATFAVPRDSQPGDRAWRDWQSGDGVYTTNGVLVGLVKRSHPTSPAPDLFIFGLPGHFKGYYPGYSQSLLQDKKHFTWAILKADTRNTAGHVRLRSADPRDVPEINFRYFDEGSDTAGEDLEAVVAGVEFVRGINRRVERIIEREVVPGPQIQTRDEIREFVRREAWGHHASCTCPIGRADDPLAVLDSQFRVRGTSRLRVVDASVFPRIPGYFIVTAIYMVSEKASEVILADAARGDPAPRPDA